MNRRDARYTRYAVVREMLETADVVRKFDPSVVEPFLPGLESRTVLLTGEGSSRIFPAKKTICDSHRHGYRDNVYTEAATQALEYDLAECTVFVASNSGRTKEGVRLIRSLKSRGHKRIYGIVANPATPIEREAGMSYVLRCGSEKAVAATKSVVEQALFYDVLFRRRSGAALPDFKRLGDLMEEAMEREIPREIVERVAGASMLYWAGRNDGVAEELTLKSNEIARKKSDFLEGTYAVHGIEEVMDSGAAVIVVDPFPQEAEKFAEVLKDGVGLALYAISGGGSPFPSIPIPTYEEFTPYVELAAGWSLLVEVGLYAQVDLDRTERARKVGNEVVEP